MKRLLFAAIITILILSACRAPDVKPTAQPGGQDDPADTSEVNSSKPAPTRTSTGQPSVSLTVCTAELPESLFPYNGRQSAAKENILSMIYPEPFIGDGENLEPLILEKVPTPADGDLRLVPVEVQQGQTVVDSRGEVVVLRSGVTVRPSGCREQSCAIVWDGETPLEMDQMVVDFTLREGLTWSDGAPVFGSDSVFSFKLARTPERPGLQWSEARTERYTSEEPSTVKWVGRPGFTTAQISRFFWKPLPAHLFSGDTGWDAVSMDERLADTPLSYGPFVISSRDADEIRFLTNPYYAQAESALNGPDEVQMHEVEGGALEAWAAMQSGICDVLDVSFGLENDPELISSIQADDRFEQQIFTNESWMQLVFGIKPASYDPFYNVANGDRPDILGDARTRRAFAHCLDRQTMVDVAMNGVGEIRHSFLPPGQSMLTAEDLMAHDPGMGIQLLEQAGWRDHDNNSATPMQAWEVLGVPIGTNLTAELLITPTTFHREIANIVVESLGACGIGVSIYEMPAADLYAPGPDGPLFGRKFDLALIAWQPMADPDCGYYQSWQIPSAENQWIGTNIAGFTNADYDHACSTAGLALPSENSQAVYQAEISYLNQIPAVPLFSPVQLMVVSQSICLPGSTSTAGEWFDRLGSIEMVENCP